MCIIDILATTVASIFIGFGKSDIQIAQCHVQQPFVSSPVEEMVHLDMKGLGLNGHSLLHGTSTDRRPMSVVGYLVSSSL